MPLIDNYLLDNYLIDGLSVGIKYASGIVIASTQQIVFYNTNDSGSYSTFGYPIVISGLSFRPNRIIIRTGPTIVHVYHADTRGATPSDSGGAIGGPYNFSVYTLSSSNTRDVVVFEKVELNDTINAYVKKDGFRLPAPVSGGTYGWEAFGV